MLEFDYPFSHERIADGWLVGSVGREVLRPTTVRKGKDIFYDNCGMQVIQGFKIENYCLFVIHFDLIIDGVNAMLITSCIYI